MPERWTLHSLLTERLALERVTPQRATHNQATPERPTPRGQCRGATCGAVDQRDRGMRDLDQPDRQGLSTCLLQKASSPGTTAPAAAASPNGIHVCKLLHPPLNDAALSTSSPLVRSPIVLLICNPVPDLHLCCIWSRPPLMTHSPVCHWAPCILSSTPKVS